MALIKISEFAEHTTPVADDVLPIVDTNTGITKKIKVQTLSDVASPAGIMVEFGGSTPPDGWLLCNGQAVSRATYSRLFAAISTAYGVGDGSTTFNVPDRRGRVGVGYDASQTDFNTLGETGGAKTHTLTQAEMPVHSHSASTDVQGNHAHTYTRWSAAIQPAVYQFDQNRYIVQGEFGDSTSVAGAHGHNVYIGNAGSGSAHNNLQPYLTSNVIIKT